MLPSRSVNQAASQSPAPGRRSQDQFFKSRDRNGDGAITLEEFIGNPKGRNVPALTKRFKNIDSNGDGKLHLSELKEQTK
jgi:Ca2+-binding EF-hand superfamily protein